jgi:hypothetical protein
MAALWFGLAKDRAESSAIAARLPVAVEIPVVRMPAATIPLPPKLTEEERAEAKRVLDEAKRSGRFTGSSPGAPPNGREVIVADRPAAEPVNREEARKALEDYLARRNLGRDPQVPNPFEKYEPLRLEALERQRRGEPPLDGLDAILTGRTLEFVLPNGVPGKAKKGGAA